jgi:hypothetical protein
LVHQDLKAYLAHPSPDQIASLTIGITQRDPAHAAIRSGANRTQLLEPLK